jgi:hypothetical protein
MLKHIAMIAAVMAANAAPPAVAGSGRLDREGGLDISAGAGGA